ncbi:putative fatty aldehyde dehydrogenase-like, partial [Apostichopus japonicus]
MGSFHGSQSFKTFSHMKPCFVDPYYKYLDCTMGVRYPPYDKKKERVMSFLMKRLTNSEKRVMFMIKLGLLITMVAVVLK